MGETKPPSNDLDALADRPDPGIVAELVAFLRANKAWWMAPILVVLALFGVIAWMASTSIAPFIYTLF